MTTKYNKKIFKNELHYWAFRKTWCESVNADQTKSQLITQGTSTYREKGWITSAHVVLFNILCDQPIDTGFTPITNKNKLLNGVYVNNGIYCATQELNSIVQRARKYIENPEKFSWGKQQRDRFLAPLDQHPGHFNIKMLASVEVATVKPQKYSSDAQQININKQAFIELISA